MTRKITWIGHSCFKIEIDGFTVVTDPYEDGSVPGIGPVRERADLVLVSHEHFDHNARSLVEVEEKADSPLRITQIASWHDDAGGSQRGPNTIHIIEADGLRIAHLGDLGCEPEAGQLEQLQGLDVCLIPVGGFFTIDGLQAAELVKRIRPKVTIPMHFRDDEAGFGFDVISGVNVFADQFDSVCRTSDSVLDLEQLPDAQVVILRPRNTEEVTVCRGTAD